MSGLDPARERSAIVRHQVMPGLVDETEAILRFIADERGPNTYVNLVGQLEPAGRTDRYKEIDRRPHREELSGPSRSRTHRS